MTSDHIDRDVEHLVMAVKDGVWNVVMDLYKTKKELRTVEVTSAGDTALHMAVSKGYTEVVKRMLHLVCNPEETNNEEALDFDFEEEQDKKVASFVNENGDECKQVLGAQNAKGDTPLHLAASSGRIQICDIISKADRSLIVKPNSAGETPLFKAAFHGEKDTFLQLYYLYKDSPQSSSTCAAHYKRFDGDTILHCAIAKEDIDFAIEIVLLYKKDLAEMIKPNDKGLTPLHLLAATPSAFKSTDPHGLHFVGQLIYHFLRVKDKEQATMREELEERELAFSSFIKELMFDLYAELLVQAVVFPSYSGIIWTLIGLLALLLLLPLLLPPVVLVLLFKIAGKWFNGIRKMKEKHRWSLQIMAILLKHASNEEISKIISRTPPNTEESNGAGSQIVDAPLMIAAKNGMIETVEQILQKLPYEMNVMDLVDDEGKNIVLLAAEKRQTKLYQFLCGCEYLDNSAFRQVDKYGNTALHLAAKPGINLNWHATTMVEEFKWFEFVKDSVPFELWEKYNKDGKTAEEIFRDNYKDYMASDRQWLNQTSQTCSVASTLVASMAFSNFAGDNLDKKNNSSLVALSLALTSTIAFLAILAFRSQSLNFWRYAPFILQLAILTMFGSIVSLWISLVLHGKSLTTYLIFGLPIAILTIVSLPIFIGPPLKSMFTKVPPPNRKTSSAMHYQRPQKKETGTDMNP